MTAQQEQFALDNIKLVYSFVHKYQLEPQEEWIDRLTVKYIELIYKFDASKNISLSTYLFKCFHNEVLQEYRKHRPSVDSLDRFIGTTDTLKLHDVVANPIDPIQQVDDVVLINQVLEYIQAQYPKYYNVFVDSVIHDYKQIELQSKYKYSQAHISRIISKIKLDIRRTFEYGR